jgi:D-amino-acid dehydrogenase
VLKRRDGRFTGRRGKRQRLGAIHFRGSPSSSDPGMLKKAYADLFTRKSGRFTWGDARSLGSDPSGWSVTTEAGPIAAREAVVALVIG